MRPQNHEYEESLALYYKFNQYRLNLNYDPNREFPFMADVYDSVGCKLISNVKSALERGSE